MRTHFKSAWFTYKLLFIISNIVLFFVGLYYSNEIYIEVQKSFDVEELGLYFMIYLGIYFTASLFYWFGAIIIIAILYFYERVIIGERSQAEYNIAADSTLSSQEDEYQKSLD